MRGKGKHCEFGSRYGGLAAVDVVPLVAELQERSLARLLSAFGIGAEAFAQIIAYSLNIRRVGNGVGSA